MKSIVLTSVVALAAACSTTQVVAESTRGVHGATVRDYYSSSLVSKPVSRRECYNVNVPVYREVTRDDNGVGAVAGAILGGVIGNQFGAGSGKDALTVLGALAGANEGSKAGRTTEREIVGYRDETKCETVQTNESVRVKTYSHSTITFNSNGKQYTLEFIK